MSSSSDPERTVWLAHRGALAVLASCAALIGISWLALPAASSESPSQMPDPVFPYTAVALGVGAITCRQRAVSNARRGRATPGLFIACFALATGIGVVGLTLFWFQNMVQAALLYTLGGAILALRPPPPMRAAGDDPRARS